jgi:hypothetical protein
MLTVGDRITASRPWSRWVDKDLRPHHRQGRQRKVIFLAEGLRSVRPVAAFGKLNEFNADAVYGASTGVRPPRVAAPALPENLSFPMLADISASSRRIDRRGVTVIVTRVIIRFASVHDLSRNVRRAADPGRAAVDELCQCNGRKAEAAEQRDWREGRGPSPP